MGAMTRVNLGLDSSGRPIVINRRTQAMLRAVEADLSRQEGRAVRLTIVQGSYRPPSAVSSFTHVGGGVVDLRTRDLMDKGLTVPQVLKSLRWHGFAAWYRTQAQGFDPHIHAVALADRQLHPEAKAQARAYRNGRNGLANNREDDGPRVLPIRTWGHVRLILKVQAAKRRLAAWRAAH